MGVHSAPRGCAEGPHATLRLAAGTRGRPHHEEPGGPDAAGLGHGNLICFVHSYEHTVEAKSANIIFAHFRYFFIKCIKNVCGISVFGYKGIE